MKEKETDYSKNEVYQAHLRDYHNFCRAITWTTVAVVTFLAIIAYFCI